MMSLLVLLLGLRQSFQHAARHVIVINSGLVGVLLLGFLTLSVEPEVYISPLHGESYIEYI